MSRSLEVTFCPSEFAALERRDLRQTVCVVFDVLRATSSMITALAHGARALYPVAGIEEALKLRAAHPGLLLGGERGGLRIRAAQSGGIDFDFGNSPREFTPEKVRGKSIAMTTTNGTRALRACAQAQTVLVGSFLNLDATAAWLRQHQPRRLLLVCGGTYEEAALEDALAAGAICEATWSLYGNDLVADSAQMARQLYQRWQADLPGAMAHARNGRRLLSLEELRADVPFCLRENVMPVLAVMQKDGTVIRLGSG